MRLQKFIASWASRLAARPKSLPITSGAVQVNGQRVTELGTRIYPERDRVVVRGEQIAAERKVYIVLNKPDQIVSSAEGGVDDRNRPTVLSLLHGISERLYPVGRLDYHSRGVMLLTTDGALAAALTHPRHGVIKTYHVKFQGKLSPADEEALREGVELDDGARTRPLAGLFAFRETDTNVWYQIGLTRAERQLRRMGNAIGHPVSSSSVSRFATSPRTASLSAIAAADANRGGPIDGRHRARSRQAPEHQGPPPDHQGAKARNRPPRKSR